MSMRPIREVAPGTLADGGPADGAQQAELPRFLGSLSQIPRAIAILGRLRGLVSWRPLGGHWCLRAGEIHYRGLTELTPTGARFEMARLWPGEVFLPAPRDVIDELSRRGYDIITSPTHDPEKPLRVVARPSSAPTRSPIELADETLYLALLGTLEEILNRER
jgi:hypothetical protein